MTALNPPLHLQNSAAHTAQGDRLLLRTLWRSVGGVVHSGDLFVAAQGSPNMTVAVAAGAAIVPGTENAFQGSYHCVNDASVNVTITAADGTNGRRDIIVARVQDQAYSGATNAWSIAVVTGTPSGSPVPPAAPVNSIILATIVVNALQATVTNANITNTATIARMSQTQWQQVVAAQPFEWYSSAGVLLQQLDSTGHVKSFGTTGGATKTRKPMVHVRLNSYSIPNASVHKVLYTFDGTVTYDTDGMWDATNNWIDINTPGIYRITTSIGMRWVNATGYRAAGIIENNSAEIVRNGADANATNGLVDTRQVTITGPCNAGASYHTRVWQNSGGALFVATAADTGYSDINFIEAEWLAPLS